MRGVGQIINVERQIPSPPRPAVHRNAATFELVRAVYHILLPYKFHISNVSRIIMLADTHLHKLTLLKTYHLAARQVLKVIRIYIAEQGVCKLS